MTKAWFKRMKEELLITLAPLPGALLIKGLHASLRIRRVDGHFPEAVKAEGGQYIMAFWHGDLLMMVYAYVGQKLTFLVSWHRDGELITRVMKYFGMNPTRGSTTPGRHPCPPLPPQEGEGGLRRRLHARRPPGPRPPGPARGGADRPAFGFTHPPHRGGGAQKKTLRSWDGFMIPCPFTRLAFAYGEPIHVPRELDDTAAEAIRLRVENALKDAAMKAEAALREETLWRV